MKNELEIWLEGRPQIIKDLVVKLPPSCRYKLSSTGQHCDVYSYSENGTVTITVNGHDSEVLDAINKMIPMNVFGINPNDLEFIE